MISIPIIFLTALVTSLQRVALCADPFSFLFMPPLFRRVSALQYTAVDAMAKEH